MVIVKERCFLVLFPLKEQRMRSFLTASVLIALIFSGCAKPPTQELDAAQAALDEAKNSEADIYAPKTYISASIWRGRRCINFNRM